MASRALGEFDAAVEIGAALRGHTLCGTCAIQADQTGRAVPAPVVETGWRPVLFLRQSNRG